MCYLLSVLVAVCREILGLVNLIAILFKKWSIAWLFYVDDKRALLLGRIFKHPYTKFARMDWFRPKFFKRFNIQTLWSSYWAHFWSWSFVLYFSSRCVASYQENFRRSKQCRIWYLLNGTIFACLYAFYCKLNYRLWFST